MTSYMYNPSKKVTELLSKYLEFDPEQLQLGIWSGHLSLSNVNLREEALYPLMNRILNKPSAADQSNYVKPPLRVKLVSGTIGSLNMKIPWKRLVWGQGDVKVEIRNIVIVLALESREETEKREKGKQAKDSSEAPMFPNTEGDEDGHDYAKTVEAANDAKMKSPVKREKKQNRLREAERRHLQDRSLSAWLDAVHRKDAQEQVKAAVDEDSPIKQDGHLDKWLRGATSDFFWRFYTGLEMTIDNLKIVMVQDGVEVGVIIPSVGTIAGGKSRIPASVKSTDETQSETGSGNLTPPQGVVYQGEYEDGEHVDKDIKYIGLSVYVRKIPTQADTPETPNFPQDVSTKEYVLRPLDADFSFSLFFPYPPERRKKIASDKNAKEVTAAHASGNSSDGSSKRRRGKREKSSTIGGDSTTDITELTSTHSSIMGMPEHRKTPIPVSFTDSAPLWRQNRRQSSISSGGFMNDSRRRRQSMVGNLRQGSIGGTPSRTSSRDSLPPVSGPGHHVRRNATTSLPLARPDNITDVYAASAVERTNMTPRFDGRVRVGAVQFVCFTRHYELLNSFLAAGSRMRNGRPTKRIRSVLGQGIAMRRSLMVDAPRNPRDDDLSLDSFVSANLSAGDTQGVKLRKRRMSVKLNLQLPIERNERSDVVRSWWYYALGVIKWELRQRKKLRKNFQDTYLSFSWEQQQYKRKEYVDLYIAVHLKSHESADIWASSNLSLSQTPEETLLALEDLFPIEQILLYRSIARAIHVRGGTEMPESIRGIHEGRESLPLPVNANAAGKMGSGKTAKKSMDQTDADAVDDDGPTYLTSIATRCESARKRRDAKEGDLLSAYEHKVPWSKVGGLGPQSAGADDSSFGFGADKTVRTFKSVKSGATGGMMDATLLSAKSSSEDAMLISFSIKMDKLEFMVVEEEFYFDGFDKADQDPRVAATSQGSLGDMDLSDMSVLTDDNKWIGANIIPEDDVDAEPIMASTDYLLFKMPEKILTHITVYPLSASLLGRSGRSRNINLTIGQIEATGENGRRLLSIGTQLGDAPVSEVNLGRNSSQGVRSGKSRNDTFQRDAISISLVIHKEKNDVLQCDTSKIKSCFDPQTLTKLFSFSKSSALYPAHLLPKSAREDVRIYVLRQNAAVVASTLNASIRVHGCELFFPYYSEKDEAKHADDDVYSYGSRTAVSETGGPGTVLKTDIIEIYSGAAVSNLSADTDTMYHPDPIQGRYTVGSVQGRPGTRGLRMLDIADLTESRDSIFSHHWVVATSGVDCLTHSSLFLDENPFDAMSLFENQLDIELLLTVNENSVLDTNRSKREVVVQVSPVHILLSESRVAHLSLMVPPIESQPDKTVLVSQDDEVLPPRLELLSRFLLYSVDLSVERIRISFITDGAPHPQNLLAKEAEVEDCIADFLSVVLSFDLSYPHEEALSSAMQICIDRLTGIGLPLEESWEATNTALLNFLEDIAEMREIHSGQMEESDPAATLPDCFRESMPTDFVQDTLQRSVERTVALFAPQLEFAVPDTAYSSAGVIIDLPDGVSLSFVKLFYDFHLNGSIPSFFVTNYAGVHILRVIPPENSVAGEDDDALDALSENAKGVASKDQYEEESFASSLQGGVGFGTFELDKSCPFGKGGLPLSTLGTDISAGREEERRERERVTDIEIGEVEILFSQELVADAVERVVRVLASIPKFGTLKSQKAESTILSSSMDSSFLVVGASVSLLLASDDLFPFSRLTLTDAVVQAKTCASPAMTGLNLEPHIRVSAKSLAILNLTPEGELYPRVVTMLPSARTIPFKLRYFKSSAGSEIQIEFHGFRVFVLRQFINECLQFFASGDFGLSLFLKKLRESGFLNSSGPKLRFRVSLFDSSVILPRCSSSSDLIALEVDEAQIFSSSPAESFAMPTESVPLDVFDKQPLVRELSRPDADESDFHDCLDSSDGSTDHCASTSSEQTPISRTVVQLGGFRAFTSVSDTGVSRFGESPSFHFFYSIDGRASTGKPVYRRHLVVNHSSAEEEEGDLMLDKEKTLRCWREISANVLSLEIFIDYAPYLRLLITDLHTGQPGTSPKPFGLDVSKSHFCLLLSVWYSNMKEPAVMFPNQSTPQAPTPYELPEHGTEQFKDRLKDRSKLTSETAIVVSQLSFRCFDGLGDKLSGGEQGLRLAFTDAVVHITSDEFGIMRIGTGSSGALLVDESKAINKVISAGNICSPDSFQRKAASWADLEFGLDSNLQTLSNVKLPQAFQFSIFMVPGWSIYQLGVDKGRVAISDFSSVSTLLDFISTYFNDPAYGNPNLEAPVLMEETIDKGQGESVDVLSVSEKDFRLWLTDPRLSIPCDSLDDSAPGLRLATDRGFWYRYTTFGEYGTQECASCDLSLLYDDKFVSTDVFMEGDPKGKSLIVGLSFGLRIDANGLHNHKDISLQIPYTNPNACGITSPRVCVPPVVLVPPTICSPLNEPNRFLGPQVCELTCIIEVLPAVTSALSLLFTSPGDEESTLVEDSTSHNFEDAVRGYTNPSALDMIGIDEEEEPSQHSLEADPTVSIVATVGDLRVFALDPVLGPHLPVAVLSIASVSITASRFAHEEADLELMRGEAPPEDLQVIVEGHFWADYFKLGLTRSWEPLLEPYEFIALYEKSRFRGIGLNLNSDSPLHLNVSGALLLILDEVIGAFDGLIRETFGMQTSPSPSNDDPSPEAKASVVGSQLVLADSVGGTSVLHETSRLLESGDRVAFSLRNDTGQKVRFYRESDAMDEASKPVVVTYVDHMESTELSFQPSISVVKNMGVTDAPYPGLPNSNLGAQDQFIGHNPSVDVQLPGFRWLQGIKVDTFGRRFESIVPRSAEMLKKTSQDWRLANMMRLLVEVGLENGGRQVVVRSLFSVVNKTAHKICLALHPDPSHSPGTGSDDSAFPAAGNQSSDALIEPGELYQVPTLLTVSALNQLGSHLGSVWAKPLVDSSDADVLHSFVEVGADDVASLRVGYSSKPVQLAKVVNESALMFDAGRGKDVSPDEAKSGVQVSCPVVQKEGERLAPFCYAVEVGRSPLVKASSGKEPEKEKQRSIVHGPVAYTLTFHPPFMVVNLLPEKGRFELMHAVRRTVVWFADLEPGQQIAIHSVGLDAPLLLFLNLGFCRTPVGEGALVHHGVDPPDGTRENLGGLKTIGKAGKAVTKQLGKTLTAIGDSPDKRGLNKMQLAQNPRLLLSSRKKRHRNFKGRNKTDLGLESEDLGTGKGDGKVHRIDTAVFFPGDVVNETTVVDAIGQRLKLQIENTRGGGGQRRISLFCPFWIVNTTEHALRYRQEKSKTFVSGTVLSPTKDGSIPLSGGRARAKYEVPRHPRGSSVQSHRPLNEETIFSGTHGALATSPGRSELDPEHLAELLDRNLPLLKLASLAFMFNFHEGMLAIGHQKLSVQLGDGTGGSRYVSDWSRGFTLESVGFSQPVGMHCKDGRALELTAVVTLAPGFLSGYTKIVRFLPRYLVINTLPTPVRVWQDSSIFRPLSTQTTADDTVSKDRKWRFRRDRHRETRKVNQYEALWGRETTLDERNVEGIAGGTTAHDNALYVTTVGPSELIPFNLPDSRGERQLRIGLGGPWNLTASFSAEVPGEHTLKVTRAVDLRLLRHVSTRASPQYDVRLPPLGESVFTGELGVWFETEYGSDRSLIVKAVKKNSFSFDQSDIHVGDELLLIGAIPVSRMTFSEAMSMLRTRLTEVATRGQVDSRPQRTNRRASLRLVMGFQRTNHPFPDEPIHGAEPLVLTFRTVEERLRRVRLKAARTNSVKPTQRHDPVTGGRSDASPRSSENLAYPTQPLEYMTAELKTLHHSMFLVLRQNDIVPYQIHNRTINSTIYYRQKGCNAHPWQVLKPGQSNSYSWEEPMKAKRLVVRAAVGSAFVDSSEELSVLDTSQGKSIGTVTEKGAEGTKYPPKSTFFNRVNDEEDAVFSPSVSVRLEEIGLREFLQHPDTTPGSPPKYLELEVDVSGAIRVLVVHDVSGEGDEEQMVRHLSALERKCKEESSRRDELQTLKTRLTEVGPSRKPIVESTDTILNDASSLMEDFSDETTVSAQNQVVVDVLEAVGLNPDNLNGFCNPFAEVLLKTGSASRKSLFKKKDTRRTYFVRKTVNPTWNSQSFVFDVPEEVASVTRGHSLQVRVRNRRKVGRHLVMGSAAVDFHSFRDQRPLVGWFPLSSRGGGQDLENPLSHWGRGSIKLKIQWIYSIPALLDYFLLLSETRLVNLHESLAGMTHQLENKMETDERKRERLDGFKAVRINDLLSMTKQGFTIPGVRKFQHLEPGGDHEARDSKIFRSSDAAVVQPQSSTQKLSKALPSTRPSAAAALSASLRDPAKYALRRIQSLSKQRLKLSRGRSRSAEDPMPAEIEGGEPSVSQSASGSGHCGADGHIVVRSESEESECVTGRPVLPFSIPTSRWTTVRAALVRARTPHDPVTSRDHEHSIPQRTQTASTEDVYRSEIERLVNLKLRIPLFAPTTMSAEAKEYATKFLRSRTMFERASKRALWAVLNPGGWLTIRPMTVLNLPDTYTGMFVKLRYGSEILVSETVDAKVNPTWQKPNETAEGNPQRPSKLRRGPGDENQRDLHIHVAPQKTSGSIQLSVIGERRSKQLLTKAELGVLHLPLGAAIASCIDCIEDSPEPNPGDAPAPIPYVRWFPLMSPKDAVPVEGDRGLSLRPPESEKTSDDKFHEYFAPCIQLAILWWPDVDEKDAANELSEENAASERLDRANGLPRPTLPLSGVTPMVKSYFNADIGRVSVALIDSQRALELVSFSALDIDVRYWVTKAKTRIGVSVGWLQLDHQDDNPREPVIFAPTPTDQFVPVIQVLAVKDNLRSETDVLSFDFIDVSLAEFDITIEENFLFDLFDFMSSVRLRRSLKRRARQGSSSNHNHREIDETMSGLDDLKDPVDPTLLSLLGGGGSASGGESKVYIEQLFLGVVKVNLSYLKGKKQAWELTTQGDWVEKRLEGVRSLPKVAKAVGERILSHQTLHNEKSDTFIKWSQQTYDEDRWAEDSSKNSQNLSGLVASLFPTVSDAPIRLQGKALNHVFESPGEIFQSIKKFYVNETLRQLYKIIGSLDFVGNPTMVLSSFVSGVRDLFLVPSLAFLTSPTDPSLVGLGVAKGTLSLVSHSASGFFGFMTKVFAAAGQAVATLSLDSDFRKWHHEKVVTEATNLNREWKRRGVQNVRSMATRPFVDVFLGFTTGVSGIVRSPYRGYRQGGNIGLLKGVAVGAIGFVARPTVGLLDAVAHAAASVHDIAKSVNLLDKRFQPALKLRLPYTFGIMNILAPFNATAARAVYLLKLFPLRKPHRWSKTPTETLVHVEVLPNVGIDTYAIVTSCRIVLIKLKKETTGFLTPSFCWEVALGGDSMVSARVSDHGHNGVALTITTTKGGDIDESEVEVLQASALESSADANQVIDVARSDSSSRQVRFEDVGEEYDHGLRHGHEGELTEWFTILAEYQYRRQLARLSNAISCIVGDFDAIIYDPSLGHPGSTEGFTSFGMFTFERKGPENTSGDLQYSLLNRLEYLNWTSYTTSTCHGELHKTLEYAQGLEASSTREGPQWLIDARAEAVKVQPLASVEGDFDRDEMDTLPPKSQSWARTPLSTIPDRYSSDFPGDEQDDTSDSARQGEVNTMWIDGTSDDQERIGLTHCKKSILREDSYIPETPMLDESGRSQLSSPRMGSVYQSAGNLYTNSMSKLGLSKQKSPRLKRNSQSLSKSGTSCISNATFYSATGDTDKTETRPRLTKPGSMVAFQSESLQTPQTATSVTRAKTSAASASAESLAAASSVPPPPPPAPAPPAPRSDDRLDRMEKLIENLLLYSTEQAVQHVAVAVPPRTNETAAAVNDGTEALRHEIEELRDQLQGQSKQEQEASMEISELRREIAALQGRFVASAAGGADNKDSNNEERSSSLEADDYFQELDQMD